MLTQPEAAERGWSFSNAGSDSHWPHLGEQVFGFPREPTGINEEILVSTRQLPTESWRYEKQALNCVRFSAKSLSAKKQLNAALRASPEIHLLRDRQA